jgi:hypothetical protein
MMLSSISSFLASLEVEAPLIATPLLINVMFAAIVSCYLVQYKYPGRHNRLSSPHNPCRQDHLPRFLKPA